MLLRGFIFLQLEMCTILLQRCLGCSRKLPASVFADAKPGIIDGAVRVGRLWWCCELWRPTRHSVLSISLARSEVSVLVRVLEKTQRFADNFFSLRINKILVSAQETCGFLPSSLPVECDFYLFFCVSEK